MGALELRAGAPEVGELPCIEEVVASLDGPLTASAWFRPVPMLKNSVEYFVASIEAVSEGSTNTASAARRPHSALSTWPSART